MAEVFRSVNGQKFEKFIARARDAQFGLHGEAFDIMQKAQRNLDAVRMSPGYTGESWHAHVRLRIEKEKLDRKVSMVDPPDGSSPGAAASIEYGHKAGPRSRGPSRPDVEGKWILHDAAGRDRRLR